MTDDGRPEPGRLLAEGREGRGKLKIFLGYAAGVGKTWSMLEAARERLAAGVDLVVGWVDTHGRPETEALLEGLEILPRRPGTPRDASFEELDLDGLLQRRPQLALVDELAHTNALGSRHRKRFGDVQELLDSGVDVYTTLNVQHLESLNDVVAQITGVRVREKVPDRVLDRADEIELVDLPPDELLVRLQEGKVHVPAQARRAMDGFFRPEKLAALREVVMRRAADRVDEQVRSYMRVLDIPGPWPTRERLLVCVGPSPHGPQLVRACARLSQGLHARWEAVYVETPEAARLGAEEEARVEATLRLAENLGGTAVRLPADSVAAGALDHARRHNVTRILVGKPLPASRFKGSLVDRLITDSGDIDIHVITGAEDRGERPPVRLPDPERSRSRPLRILKALAVVGLATLLGEAVDVLFHITNLVMLYLLAVVVAAVRWGRSPAAVAAAASVVAFDFFFVPPRYTFNVEDPEYLLTFAGLFAVGLLVANLAAREREQVELSRRSQRETMAAYSLARDLSRAGDLDATVAAVLEHLGAAVAAPATVFLARGDDLEVHPRSPVAQVSEEDRAAARWVLRHSQAAGRGTDILAGHPALYLPLATARGAVGVLRLAGEPPLRASEWRAAETVAGQAALAVERVRLAEEARRAEVLAETERLQTALINSVSHDLQTPLAIVLGTLDSLRDPEVQLDDETGRALLASARAEAERLSHLVGNLLEMSRVEAGAVRLNREPVEVQDLVGAALRQVETRFPQRRFHADLPDGVPMVRVDFVLLVQVLVNLLDNAAKYSAPDAAVDLRVDWEPGRLQVQVIDRGRGIPAEDRERVFDKFYRVRRPEETGGTGLGLTICRGLVEAHGGRVEALETPGGGTTLRFEIPLEEEA